MDKHTARELRIAALVATHEEALRRGEHPSLDQLLADNSDIAAELREQLAVGDSLRGRLCTEAAPPQLRDRIWADLRPAGKEPEHSLPPVSKADSAGEFLAESRRGRNLPVRELASKLGAQEQEIRRIEGDQWNEQDWPLIERICKFLGVALDEFRALIKGQALRPSVAFHRRKGGRKRPKP